MRLLPGLLAAALAGALGCSRAPTPMPKAEPLPVAQPADAPGGVVILPKDPRGGYPDPLRSDELTRVVPAVAALPAEAQEIARAALNLTPAPCAPCEGRGFGRCLAEGPPVGCENLPGLVQRLLGRLAAGEPPEVARLGITYPEPWFPGATEGALLAGVDTGVPVVLWVDPAAPSLSPALLSARALPLDRVSLRVRFLPAAAHPGGEALAAAVWAAAAQGQGMALLESIAAERARQKAAGKVDLVAALPALLAALPGLDPAAHRAAAAAAVPALAADRAAAPTFGLAAAPAWFVGGYRLRGAQSELAILRLVDLAAPPAAGVAPPPAPAAPPVPPASAP